MKFVVPIFSLLLAMFPQAEQDQDQVHVLLIGEIRKIDVKGGIITIRERMFPERRGRPPVRPPDLGPGFPPGGPPRGGGRGAAVQDTKVVYSSETTFKASDEQLSVNDLKVGDSVQVRGRQKNKDFVATEIERLKKKP
jgi:hypothetical protein